MNATRINRLALVAGLALAAGAASTGIRVAAADEAMATRKAGTVVQTRANVDVNADLGRSGRYAMASAPGGTIIGAADPDRAVLSRPDLTRSGRQ